jgi:hypothetical protein
MANGKLVRSEKWEELTMGNYWKVRREKNYNLVAEKRGLKKLHEEHKGKKREPQRKRLGTTRFSQINTGYKIIIIDNGKLVRSEE